LPWRRGSWHLFRRALDSDIADIHGGTTPEKIRLGVMAGTIDFIRCCDLGDENRGRK
jgi:alpha,alpha-trehalase